MLVQEWMSTDLIIVSPQTTLKQAAKLMKDNRIRCLPVVDADRRILGLISDRDLKSASPSLATTMDVHEVHYLFRDLKAKDIMTREVITITSRDTMEKAAVIMQSRKISSLPVVEDGMVVGLITSDDVARVLTTITGIYRGGTQFAFTVEDRPGAVGGIKKVIKKYGGEIVSVLSIHSINNSGYLDVFIRSSDLPRESLNSLTQELEDAFTLVYVAENELADI